MCSERSQREVAHICCTSPPAVPEIQMLFPLPYFLYYVYFYIMLRFALQLAVLLLLAMLTLPSV